MCQTSLVFKMVKALGSANILFNYFWDPLQDVSGKANEKKWPEPLFQLSKPVWHNKMADGEKHTGIYNSYTTIMKQTPSGILHVT